MGERRILAGLLGAMLIGIAPAREVDVLITGGTLHDGSGAAGRQADIGLLGDRIAFIGNAASAGVSGRRRIDASGLIVAPGFIDPHTHVDTELHSPRRAQRANVGYLTQGVTTVVVGNDGGGEPAVADTLSKLESAGIGTNVATFVGFGPVRKSVMGESSRPPSDAELARMRKLVARGICEGALGFSTGLYYAPQSFARTEEVIALAREAGSRGAIYETHLRDEGSESIGLLAAVEEALRIGRESGAAVHIAHIKALGVDVHGLSGEVIALIEAERARGLQVSADQYAWLASGTRVSNALVPRWVMDGGRKKMRERLRDEALAGRIRQEMADNLRRRGGAQSLLLTSGPWRGMTLSDLAREQRVDAIDAAVRIVLEGDARVASFNMDERDVKAFMAQPWVVSSSDGSTGHPRKFASFPLKFARYVRQEKLLDTAEFIRRSSALTAGILGIPERGLLRVGHFADVIVFDPEKFRPAATYESPEELTPGVVYAFVNGEAAIDAGKPTLALAGRAIRREPPAGTCGTRDDRARQEKSLSH